MIYTPLTKKAMRFAFQAHDGQTDKSGLPYIQHPLHVAEQMTNEVSTAAALLHDVMEDCGISREALQAAGFPEAVISAVCHLTHEKSVPYLDYIRALRTDPIAVQVKLADLAHNSDLTRLDEITEKDRLRVQKYQEAMKILRVTRVVAALIWDGERFLICQRPRHKARGLQWEFVGGKIEPNETGEQALIRECQEELDITVRVHEVFAQVLHLYQDLTVALTVYRAEIASGTPKLLEHEAMQWIRPTEIDQYDFCPADVEILEKIKQVYG